MAERLALVRVQPTAVIDWSAWLGGGAAALAAAYPHARRIVVEPHGALRERSARAADAPWWSLRRWAATPATIADDDAQLPDGAAQLLWSNMALHMASDPLSWLRRWRRLVAIDGFLMFSTLGPDTLATLRALYRTLGWPPPAQDFIDMHDIGDLLVQAGFAEPVMDQEHLSLTWDSVGALLGELRALGGNLHPARQRGLRTPRWRRRLESALGERSDAQGRIALGFEIVYGHAFVAAPRAAVAARTEVPLADLRAMIRRGRR